MRGADGQSGSMFSYVSLEERVPKDHPLRAIRRITDRALEQLSPRFRALYIHFGRPSVPPEKLLRALLLQALYTIRSERQLMEQLDYNLLFRWFVGLGMDDAVFYVATQAEAIYVLHAFEKKTQKTSAHDLDVGRDRFRALGKLRQKHGKEKRG